MNCPKCNFEIDEKVLVCPNCKKVLKLICPKCNTLNQGSICKKCGFTIISKCHQCGKINQTIDGKCKKCGFSTYSSIAINNSNIDEFACLIINFPNINDIKSALGSTKLFEKFKINLDRLIYDYTLENNLHREIINESYVIRFNKNNSFSESANSAINGAIKILNLITELNAKLNNLKNILLQCHILILKRDINSKPEDYKSGFDIKLIYQGKNKVKLLTGLQVITDEKIYEQVCDNFKLSTLSSTFIKGQTVTFFELNIKKYVKIPVRKEDDDEMNILSQLPVFEEEIPMELDLYNIDAINFYELSSNFINVESGNIITQILNKVQKNPLNLIAVKSIKEFAPDTEELFTKLEKSQRFTNVFKVTCTDEMKYQPYGFFRELILNICDFSIAPKNFSLNTFEMFSAIDTENYIYNLINLLKSENSNPDEVRKLFFDIFFNIFGSISESLIYIEDIDKIDATSYEFLQLFFEKFNEFKISYVITMSKDFSLHKDAHFLLSNCFYTNITLIPAPFKEILSNNIKKYSEILKTDCIEKIARNFKGSLFYFNQAISYLIDSGYLSLNENGILMLNNQENIFIPTSLDTLIEKRLKILSKDKNAYKLLVTLLILGPRVDIETINLLGINEVKIEIKKLIDAKYIYTRENCIFVNNYNLLKDNCFSVTSDETIKTIALDLLQKVFVEQTPHPTKSLLYEILKTEKEQVINWEKLSQLSSSLADFNSYLNCSDNLLKLVDNNIEGLEKSKENYKTEIFENVSTLLYKFSPDKAYNITKLILDNLEKSTDNEKIFRLCSKMLEGCLIDGNYSYAFELIYKIFLIFPNASVNPSDKNFNISFFMLSLIKLEILFSLGNLNDCIEAGEEILNSINPNNILEFKPDDLSLEQFKQIIFDAMVFVVMSKLVLLQSDLENFIQKIQKNIGQPPEFFNLFLALEKVIRGIEPDVNLDIQTETDKFSKIIINITKAFTYNKNDYKEFADDFHQAKMSAKMNNLSQIELICDLFIGYAYFKLNQDIKAYSIYNSVLGTSSKHGLKTVTYITWYFISMLKFKQQDIDIALGIAENAVIQLEKDSNSGDFLFFLFRMLLAEILIAKGENKSAELCLQNAKFIKEKYRLKFEIGEIS